MARAGERLVSVTHETAAVVQQREPVGWTSRVPQRSVEQRRAVTLTPIAVFDHGRAVVRV